MTYSKEQKNIMALLAYECLNKHYADNDYKRGIHYAKICALEHACVLVGIPDSKVWQIREGKIKGLQNLNKIASYQEYEQDYKF